MAIRRAFAFSCGEGCILSQATRRKKSYLALRTPHPSADKRLPPSPLGKACALATRRGQTPLEKACALGVAEGMRHLPGTDNSRIVRRGLHLLRQPTSGCHLPPLGKALELFALKHETVYLSAVGYFLTHFIHSEAYSF